MSIRINITGFRGLLKELFGKNGEAVFVEPPFHCDYGYNIEVGENFFANYNCTVLDVAKVQIGKNVMLGPNVSFYTAGHPLHHESRNSRHNRDAPAYPHIISDSN